MRAAIWQVRSRLEILFSRSWGWVLVSLLLLGWAIVFSLSRGAADLSTWEAALALLDSMHPMRAVILDVRLPRVLGGALVGANLAVAGLLLQTTVRNPLADPGILGVTAGAGVAALVVILLFPEQIDWMPWAAFIGGILAVGVVLALSWSRDGRGGALRMVLSGVALQAIFFACIALLTFAFADRAPSFVSFTVGSLNGTGWSDVKMLIAPTLIGLTASVIAIRPLDLLLLDDGTATGLGLAVRHVRLLAASTAALLAASAVSVAGLIGFVGLVVPNGMRLVVGPEHKILLPLSALVGASLVLLADVVSRMALAPLELPVGAFMALIGGPYFLYLLWRKLP